MLNYVNEKNGGSDPRSKDLMSEFVYVGHATPGDLDLGWENHGLIASAFSEELDVSQFDKKAFSEKSNADLVGGCRTAVSATFERSVEEQMADKVGGTVKGSDVRVYYPGGIISDQQLVQYNIGHIVTIQGRNETTKQGVENKKK